MKLLLASFSILFLANISVAQSKSEKEIAEFLKMEENIWNSGDIDGYVDLYMPDNSSLVIKKKGLIKGKEAILADYKSYFTSKEIMGHLTLESDYIEKMNKNTYYVTGYFHLTYPDGKKIDGRYSSLMKKVKGKWYIYTDHSS